MVSSLRDFSLFLEIYINEDDGIQTTSVLEEPSLINNHTNNTNFES